MWVLSQLRLDSLGSLSGNPLKEGPREGISVPCEFPQNITDILRRNIPLKPNKAACPLTFNAMCRVTG
jgi:hypothetical protein